MQYKAEDKTYIIMESLCETIRITQDIFQEILFPTFPVLGSIIGVCIK